MSSIDAAESRKRVLDEEARDSPDSRKRAAPEQSNVDGGAVSAVGPSSDESSRLVKVLCPHNIVGSLIGKNGITVNAMIDSSGAKIRFSQASEHYPGTTDRTVLIVGNEVCVLNALQDVTTRMCESIESSSDRLVASPSPTIRMLLPLSAIDVIIGPEGNTLKQLSVSTACNIEFEEPIGEQCQTGEKILVISGASCNQVVQAARLVTATFHSDHVARVYSNATTMYSKGRSVAQLRDIPRDLPRYGDSRHRGDYSQPYDNYSSRYAPYADYGYDRGYHPVRSHYPVHDSDYDYRDNFRRGGHDQYRDVVYGGDSYGRDSNYRDPYMEPYGQYGGMPNYYARGGSPGATRGGYYDYDRGPRDVSRYAPPVARYSTTSHIHRNTEEQRQGVHVPSPEEVQSAMDVTLRYGITVGSPYVGEGGGINVVIGVPEGKMGLVLGRRGVVIQEIKVISGAQIQVSQKNNYMPGTTNRSVTVSGSEAQVQSAQSMIIYQLGGAEQR